MVAAPPKNFGSFSSTAVIQAMSPSRASAPQIWQEVIEGQDRGRTDKCKACTDASARIADVTYARQWGAIADLCPLHAMRQNLPRMSTGASTLLSYSPPDGAMGRHSNASPFSTSDVNLNFICVMQTEAGPQHAHGLGVATLSSTPPAWSRRRSNLVDCSTSSSFYCGIHLFCPSLVHAVRSREQPTASCIRCRRMSAVYYTSPFNS